MLSTFMVAVAEVSSSPGGSGDDEKVIASRYRVEQRLAKGGMGVVYRAFDPVYERTVALKRLHSGGPKSRQRKMFEREYAALVGLRHPRIIDVYEYGVDAIGPYYTMELLDGRDLRELSPLPASLACRYLRDVASSLALLHARRLLHRDLSPRNVRITSDQRAKLIDFGGLATFGKHSTVVGTPPCVPPEALRGAALDQRADLYSLGALAYFLLTGRHAYEIRTLPELATSFRSPPPPPPSQATGGHAAKEPIDAELDELVMALLSRDPLARPASAAEVISRLSAIASMPAEREPHSAASYLLGGKVVGRARERAKLRSLRKRAANGRGSTVILDAVPGMGAARILRDLALEAQLMGAVTAVVDARTARGTLGVAHALLRSIMRSNPALAEIAASGLQDVLTPMLAEDSVEVRRHSVHGARDTDPREQRLREQRALVGFFERLTEHAPVVLCVRGLEHTDPSSATLLWALSQNAPEQPLMLVLAIDPTQPPAAPTIVRDLGQRSTRMALRPLSPAELQALVETSFGQVPGTERMAAWLHRVSGGNPLGCLDLLRHLIDSNAIRFAEGVWALPSELSSAELPTALEQVIEARIDRLPSAARKLANALSVTRGRVPRERCIAIAKLEGIEDGRAAVEALIEAQILVPDHKDCRFSHETLRRELAGRLDAAERNRLHRVLGSLLSDHSRGDPEVMLDAGWHLLNGGDAQRGATLLADAGAQIAWNASAMPAAIPALRAALDAFREQQRGAHELARLLGPLVMAGYYTDRRIMEQYGEEALSALAGVVGVTRAERWAKRVGAPLGMALGLGAGLLGFVRRYGLGGFARFRDTLVMFFTACTMMIGLAVIVTDGSRARRYAQLMTALLPLGGIARLSHDLGVGLSMITEDRHADAVDTLRAVVQASRAARPIGMSEGSLRLLRSSALYALGSSEAMCEDPRALERATELDSMGSLLFELFANQIRTLHHSLRGETSVARDYRARVESYALQAGSSWQAEVWASSSRILACELVRDLEEAKRIMEELDRLAAEIPSLERQLHLARSSYHKLRGDPKESMRWRDPVRTTKPPRSFNGWAAMMAGHVLDCARTNDLARAIKDGREALALYEPRELIATAVLTPLHVELALAEAEAGELATARERIDGALARTAGRGPATHGTLHEAAARIALADDDRERAIAHQLEMERCFRPTGNPLLVARCERLKRAIARLKQRPTQDDLRDTLDLGPPAGGESARPLPNTPNTQAVTARPRRRSVPPGSDRP